MTAIEHDVQGPNAGVVAAQPLVPPALSRRATAGEEARTLVAGSTRGSLATLAVDPPGHPFASMVPYGLFPDGSPVLFVSAMAEHTRNLDADARASLLVTEPGVNGDPMAAGRVTLLGDVQLIEGDDAIADARAAYLTANPDAAGYIDFGDFSFRRLCVERVRWVGGFGRMAWCDASAYARAEPDPVRPIADGALAHLNDDHADALLAAVRAFGGHPDASAARAAGIDRYGIDLEVQTPRGPAGTRVGFDGAVTDAATLRQACTVLARLARSRP